MALTDSVPPHARYSPIQFLNWSVHQLIVAELLRMNSLGYGEDCQRQDPTKLPTYRQCEFYCGVVDQPGPDCRDSLSTRGAS